MDREQFSPWLHWNQRSLFEERNRSGVYVLARFEEGAPDTVDTEDKRILLIGETHHQTLEKRWDQFHYCAFTGGDGHAGGRTFHRLFYNGTDSAVPPWLFVSAHATDCQPWDAQDYVQTLKNRLLAAFEDRHGVLPRCNTRGPIKVARPTPPGGPAETPDVVKAETPLRVAELPQIIFQSWSLWRQRSNAVGVDAAGVYTLALFDSIPSSAVDVLDERVVYIGETCDNSLAGRLGQFNRSAFLAKPGHSGGWSYRSRCGDAGERLFVSIFPVSALQEPDRSAFIRHVERLLLWEYVQRWGRRPLCNSK